MGTLSVTQLKSGMILSADLIAPNGRFILPKGACLTSKNIMSLKIWGIAEVPVSDRPERTGGDLLYSSSVMEEARKIIYDLFGGLAPDSSAMEEIYRVGILEAARSLAEEEQHAYTAFFEPELPRASAASVKPSIQQLVEAEVRFTTFPDVYFRVSEALQSPRSSIVHVADLISKDTALTATLLKLANSAIYGVPGKVDSITRAAALIGGKALSILALGVSAVKAFSEIPAEWVDMDSFWKHSVGVAVFGQILASKKNPRSIETVFVGGILHDIGRMVLLRHVPFVMANLIKDAAAERVPLLETERKTLGFDHAELGGALLDKWGFPRAISDLVRFHHAPEDEMNSFPVAVLAFADVLAGALRQGRSGSKHPPRISDAVWSVAGLPPGQLDIVVRQGRRQIQEIYSLFKGGDNDGKTVSHT